MTHSVPVAYTPISSTSTKRPPTQPKSSDLDLFKYTVELARITETIIVSTFKTPSAMSAKSFYNFMQTSHDLGALIGVTVEQERMLLAWKKSLSEHLRFESIQLHSTNDGQRLALYARYIQSLLRLSQILAHATTITPTSLCCRYQKTLERRS
jgi:hypothetical protein